MRNLFDAPELKEFEHRVQSNYGRGNLSHEDFLAIMREVGKLRLLCEESIERTNNQSGYSTNSAISD